VNDFHCSRSAKTKTASDPRQSSTTFCPVGPVVADGLDPWTGVLVETASMAIFGNPEPRWISFFPLDVAIRYISRIMTLEPGDLIAGTPKRGPVVAGRCC